MKLKTKTDAEMTDQERAERKTRLAALRNQILSDQRTGAKRDEEALEREREWLRQNRKP